MTRQRMGTAALAAVMALGMLGTSWAWACTAMPSIVSVNPAGEASANAGANFGNAGSMISVQGSAVTPGSAVTIRWNATEGPVIGVGTASDTGQFDIVARVPETAPGVYYLVAAVDEVGVARSAFEVTGTAAAAPQSSLWAATSAPSATGGSTPAAVVGLALLGGGLVALFAGVGVATLGRRPGRATAQ